jgi:hypothetical protein
MFSHGIVGSGTDVEAERPGLFTFAAATAASAVLKMFPPADWNWVSA